jgi:hypothetical protein
VEQDDFETINVQINGAPREQTWRPMAVELVHEDEGKRLARSDSPWLGSYALIFRKAALGDIQAVLETNGELLPLRCSEAELVIHNPTQILDALDESASSVIRFDNGRIMMIQQHAFRRDVIRDVDIFKIPNLRVSPTFVSQRFVDQWQDSGLTGLEFEQVWAPA